MKERLNVYFVCEREGERESTHSGSLTLSRADEFDDYFPCLTGRIVNGSDNDNVGVEVLRKSRRVSMKAFVGKCSCCLSNGNSCARYHTTKC